MVEAKLLDVEQAPPPVIVKLADGALSTCDREFVCSEWWCQGATALTNMMVLLIGGCYDAIISMNWLQPHNPMGIHWVGKHLRF
jgi:hypothetical protein